MATNLDERLSLVSVIGAAGKMRSGITLLMAQEMARLSLLPENRKKVFRLNAIDLDPTALRGLQDYVRVQALKAAEKGAVGLRRSTPIGRTSSRTPTSSGQRSASLYQFSCNTK